jgi:hypothetical protein
VTISGIEGLWPQESTVALRLQRCFDIEGIARSGKDKDMLTRRNLVSAIAVIGSGWAVAGAVAQEKDTLQRPPSKLALVQEQVEQLLLLMDTDKNGKISKTEWIDFMSAEFDRLDRDKSGQLNVYEIASSRMMATRRVNTGK